MSVSHKWQACFTETLSGVHSPLELETQKHLLLILCGDLLACRWLWGTLSGKAQSFQSTEVVSIQLHQAEETLQNGYTHSRGGLIVWVTTSWRYPLVTGVLVVVLSDGKAPDLGQSLRETAAAEPITSRLCFHLTLNTEVAVKGAHHCGTHKRDLQR